MQCLRSLRGVFLAACIFQFSQLLSAQINAERLLETQWHYTYTLHLETNSVVQQASDTWRHFLWFRFDGTCVQNFNSKTSESPCRFENQQVHFPFRQKNDFAVVRLNDFSLDLRYADSGGKNTYIHHFVRVKNEDSPFARSANVLPVVQVLTVPPVAPAPSQNAPANDDDICVELIGGGYYGGINPVQQDYITITRAGRLIHEFESVRGDRLVQKVKIPKEELEKFLEWAATEQRFFEFENNYDCKTPDCEKRKTVKPTPVPLRLRIAKGEQKKMVTVSIWGLDKNGRRYVDYPPALDRIADAIERMANQVR
jgi:hypothetical protein